MPNRPTQGKATDFAATQIGDGRLKAFASLWYPECERQVASVEGGLTKPSPGGFHQRNGRSVMIRLRFRLQKLETRQKS